jgi:sugar/nucleoside kinase (ribokinase family)
LLASGGVHVLKVNSAELAALTAACGTEDCDDENIGGGVGGDCTLPSVIASRSLALLRKFSGARGGGLQCVAITNGPRPAVLAELVAVTDASGSGSEVRVWTYTVPDVCAACGSKPVVNPIGAGDTVAGVMLGEWLLGWPLASAFAAGLAAGSASCLTLTGADWDAADAAAVLAGMTMACDRLVE